MKNRGIFNDNPTKAVIVNRQYHLKGRFVSGFILALGLVLGAANAAAQTPAPPRVIHVFVALADNASQGIVPVPAAIGNGDDPAGNLYWGCDEGLKSYFKRSKAWKLVQTRAKPAPAVLERLVFRHAESGAWLVADAYRGSRIRQATVDFLSAAAGARAEATSVTRNQKFTELRAGGGAALVAYIGHDGLMDFRLAPGEAPRGEAGKAAIVLCCKSADYFEGPLREAGARPLLLTTQLMYPGSFILHAALEGWLKGEGVREIRERAAKAYAGNQGISVKSARGVFKDLKGKLQER